jgi:hypothetical protein
MKKTDVAALVLGTALLASPMAFAGENGAKCGAGKCGGDKTKKETKASCGAGKCGAMKDNNATADGNKSVEGATAGKKAGAKCGA